jgi:hypothetical protein
MRGKDISRSLCTLLFAVILFAAFLTSCGSGGGGSPAMPVDACSGGWVTIDYTTADSAYTSNCNSVYLEGEAFISPTWWRCCSGSALEDTGATVNVNGLPADQTVDYGILAWLYNHRWRASTELSVGDNLVSVTATDPAGLCGQASVGIKHPFPKPLHFWRSSHR